MIKSCRHKILIKIKPGIKSEPHQRTGYNVTDGRNIVFIVKRSVARGIQMYLSVSFTEPKAL